MKGHKIRFLSVIATFMLISSILSSQALAVARSSKYLDAYGTYVSPVGNGKIVITIAHIFSHPHKIICIRINKRKDKIIYVLL